MEKESLTIDMRTCEKCRCEIGPQEDIYYAFGMALCYECAIDADPENPDYEL